MKRGTFWVGFLLAVGALLLLVDIGVDWGDSGWSDLEQGAAAPFLALRNVFFMTALMQVVSALGSSIFLFLLVTALLVLPSCGLLRHERLALFGAAAGSGILNYWLKSWFTRPRPGADYSPLVQEPLSSFPSGHAMISLCTYGFLAYLLWRKGRKGASMALAGLILAIGLSRVYLAAHYPGDVLGGFAAGYACLFLVVVLSRMSDKS